MTHNLHKFFMIMMLNMSMFQHLLHPEAYQIHLKQPITHHQLLLQQKKKKSWTNLTCKDTLIQLLILLCFPTTFESVVKEEKWQKAMDDEINSIEKNDIWEMCDLLKGQNTIGVKWVFKKKLNKDGDVDKYKARLVAKGYKQHYMNDYTKVFSPVARHDSIRLVVALAAHAKSFPIFQLDIKWTFLHGYLEEHVFIDQPPNYVKVGYENKVYRLKRALYWLKQVPRVWYNCIETYFLQIGFVKCPYDTQCLLRLKIREKCSQYACMLMILYLQEIAYVAMFSEFKKSMMNEFEMSDMGLMHYYLGIEVMQLDNRFLSL